MYQIIIQKLEQTKQTRIEIKPNNIAIGIVQVTAILANGDNIDICPKFKNIIGKVKTIADKVRVKAVLISKKFGRKSKVFSKNF